MIDYIESAKLNGMSEEKLRLWFKNNPKSNKRIIRICDRCNKKREITFAAYHPLCRKCTHNTSEVRKNHTKSHLKEKSPLPADQEISIPKNKNCGNYLGYLAEEALAKTFKKIRRMSPQNHGYDLICDQNYKIDVKSSALGYKGYWGFGISKNTIADYFLCVGFESRDDLTNPIHLWLIPGREINHLTRIVIFKSTLKKWSQYEQSLDKITACCSYMEHNQK